MSVSSDRPAAGSSSGENASVALAILCPIAMAFLVQYPGTKLYRLAVYPVGVISALWAVWTIGRDGGILGRHGGKMDFSPGVLAAFFEFLIKANISLAGPEAFSNKALTPHPLPGTPPYPALRQSNLFRTFDLIINYSKVNIPPAPALRANPNPPSRLRVFITHILWATFHWILVDAFTYPISRIYPTSFNDRSAYRVYCGNLAREWNVPYAVVMWLNSVLYAGTVYNGMLGGWCMAKAFGVGSGIWLEEEWPKLLNRPYLSTSINEMWGKRYHQMLRSYFDTLLVPLNLSRPWYLLLAFTISGLHHVLMFYPVSGFLNIHFLTFFAASGVICIIERAWWKITGRRVGGVFGWIWVMFWSVVLSLPLLEVDYTWGFVQSFRPPIEWNGKSLYPVDLLAGWTRR